MARVKLADLAERAGRYMTDAGWPRRPEPGLLDPVVGEFVDGVRFPVAVERMIDGDRVTYRARCPRCGKEWTQAEARVSHACADTYVLVGRDTDALHSDRIPGRGAVVMPLELHPEDGYGIFAKSGMMLRWSFADRKAHFDAEEVFVFSAEFGLRPVVGAPDGSVMKKDTTGEARALRAALKTARVAGEPVGPFLKACGVTEDEPEGAEVLAAMVRHSERILADRATAKKKPSAARAREDAVGTRDWDASRVEALVKARGSVAGSTALMSAEKRDYGELPGRVFARCPHCGKVGCVDDAMVFERPDRNGFGVEPRMKCRYCGEEMRLPLNWRSPHKYQGECSEYFSWYDEDDGLFVRRDFRHKMSLDASGVFSEELEEIRRLLIGGKSVAEYVPRRDGGWERVTCYDSDSSYTLLQEPEEIREAFGRTDIRRSGLLVCMGLMELPGRKLDTPDMNWMKYIRAWQKHPFIETLLMAGLTRMVYGFVERNEDPSWVADGNATTPREILGVSKQAFRIIREANVPFREVSVIRDLCDGDSSFTIEDWRFLDGRSPEDLLNIKESYGIPVRKSVEYLTRCYDYQCIEWREALTEWRDYLAMARKMKYDLSDKTRMFPRSLKLEHDKATFAYRAVEEEIRRESFTEQAELNKRYEYSYGDFLVKIPETPEEIVAEGTAQKHCVASYVNQVADAQTCVAFIRKKDDPDAPYFTVEIRDGSVRQVRGYCNRAPRDGKLLEFLGRFASAKRLTLAYR